MSFATTLARPVVEQSLVDRWIYVAMAALFLVTAIVGFGPRSVEILTGVRRNPPFVVHVHAALIVAWLGVVAAMVAVTIWRFDQRVSLGQTAALLLAPVIIHDVARLGRPHSAYLIGLALMLPWMIATELLWNSPWWVAAASRLMGAT